jgi:para-nitrobenzyl esterase
MGNATAGLAGGVIRDGKASAEQRPAPPPPNGAVHSAEIEYAMGNLATNTVYAWTPDDHKVSQVMQAYFANFIKTGDPNGAASDGTGTALPRWPANRASQSDAASRLRIDVETRAEPISHGERYTLLDQIFSKLP